MQLPPALASADDDQLRSAAGHWSQTEEFFGQGDPEILTDALRELAELARRANANRRLYCRVCVKAQSCDILVLDAPSPHHRRRASLSETSWTTMKTGPT